jgi:hypothetical protein
MCAVAVEVKDFLFAIRLGRGMVRTVVGKAMPPTHPSIKSLTPLYFHVNLLSLATVSRPHRSRCRNEESIMSHQMSSSPIRDTAFQCAILFDAAVQRVHGETQEQAKVQADRFSLWASNIGVFAARKWSLDFRLRHAPDVSDLICKLLRVLLLRIRYGNRQS